MHQVPSSSQSLVVLADFTSMSPQLVFDHLTKPEFLTLWWPEEAEVDLKVGGAYAMSWPSMDWHLRGIFLAVDPGKHLAFTWNWDHDPDPKEKSVQIYLETFGDTGSRLGLFHGDFHLGAEGEADRQGTAEGWLHYLSALEGLDIRTTE